MAELESLPRGEYLRFCHRMNPCHLYAVLERNGLAWDTRHGETVACELFIWHKGDLIAEAAARAVADTLRPWKE